MRLHHLPLLWLALAVLRLLLQLLPAPWLPVSFLGR
jgi:hypothetical protein